MILKEDVELSNLIQKFCESVYDKLARQLHLGYADISFNILNPPGILSPALRNLRLQYGNVESNLDGFAVPGKGIVVNSNNIDPSNKMQFVTVLVHEIRHLLNNYLSDNNSTNNYPKIPQDDADITPEIRSQYNNHPDEVSSRIEESLLIINKTQNNWIGPNGIQFDVLKNLIIDIGNCYDLSKDAVKPQIYKRYVRRVVQYAIFLYSKRIKNPTARQQYLQALLPRTKI